MTGPESSAGDEQRRATESTQSGWCGSTDWSALRLAGRSGAPGSTEALQELCTRYRQPIYGYIWRRCQDRTHAEDLTQGFFEQFLKRDGLAGLDESKGRFRSYLLVCIKNFLANEWDKDHAEKRGSGQPLLSLEEMAAEERYWAVEPGLSPDALYDRRWALAVLSQAMVRLRNEEERAGRGASFKRLHCFLTVDNVEDNYQAAAAELGLSREAVSMAVQRLGKRFRQALRTEIAATVKPGQVDEEVRCLKAALRGT